MPSTALTNKKAFTLVELAIVIVIIGLLVGGVLAGQALIETSKLNREIADLNSFYTAHTTFMAKYNCLPGDCLKGSVFLDNTKCTSLVSFSVGCNGNGNQKYDVWLTGGSGPNDGGDPMRYWVHLELAGLLKGASKTNNESTYRTTAFSQLASHYAAHGDAFNDSRLIYKFNFLAFTGNRQGQCNTCSVLTPYGAHYIDTKLDNGTPSSGKIIGIQGAVSSSVFPAVGTCLNGNDYNLSNDGISCYLIYSLE